jgi:non-ribosomal peptide synthetase component F
VAGLCFVLIRGADGIRAAVEHPTGLFDAATIARWSDHLVRLLDQVGRDPERPPGSYAIR